MDNFLSLLFLSGPNHLKVFILGGTHLESLFEIKGAYWISSNSSFIHFSLLLFQLCDSKVVALNPLALFFVKVL